MAKTDFKLDLNETFDRLARPPIVEAVIHWQARAQKSFEPEQIRSMLTQKLPEYTSCESLTDDRFKIKLSSEPAVPLVLPGYRLKTNDGRYVVQFKPDGVVFSRTHGYENWEPFTASAKHVWNVYLELAAPLEIHRLGVRFINHFADATPETLKDILVEPPTRPANLPLKEFVYQSTFAVPGHPFGIRVIKVIQPSEPEQPQSSGLFLDNDVFTTTAIKDARDEVEVQDALTKMRWLKNKVFFTLVKNTFMESFR